MDMHSVYITKHHTLFQSFFSHSCFLSPQYRTVPTSDDYCKNDVMLDKLLMSAVIVDIKWE